MFFECTQVPGAVGVIHGAVLGIRGLLPFPLPLVVVDVLGGLQKNMRRVELPRHLPGRRSPFPRWRGEEHIH